MLVYGEMGQASEEEEEEEEEEEGVTDREAGPDLISSTGKLTVINLINVHQQFPCSQAPSVCFNISYTRISL